MREAPKEVIAPGEMGTDIVEPKVTVAEAAERLVRLVQEPSKMKPLPERRAPKRASKPVDAQAPWERASDSHVIAVDASALGWGQEACLSVIGSLGENRGLILFHSFDDYERFTEALEPPRREGRPPMIDASPDIFVDGIDAPVKAAGSFGKGKARRLVRIQAPHPDAPWQWGEPPDHFYARLDGEEILEEFLSSVGSR
jgi:hypothetical protein